LSLEALRQKLQRQQFTAFELKLRDWRKGLVQELERYESGITNRERSSVHGRK
jgi:hypothetical protein